MFQNSPNSIIHHYCTHVFQRHNTVFFLFILSGALNPLFQRSTT